MNTLQSEVLEALREIDIPEDKALKAAAALARRDADVAGLRTHPGVLKTDNAAVKTDVAALKADVAWPRTAVAGLPAEAPVVRWMLGFVLAFQVATLVKLFIH